MKRTGTEQAVVTPEHRGDMGMHYTSVPNIMKVMQPLFLDELYEELEKAKGNAKKLNLLHLRLQNLKIFDPACGSGYNTPKCQDNFF